MQPWAGEQQWQQWQQCLVAAGAPLHGRSAEALGQQMGKDRDVSMERRNPLWCRQQWGRLDEAAQQWQLNVPNPRGPVWGIGSAQRGGGDLQGGETTENFS